jgi:hypothetical protein
LHPALEPEDERLYLLILRVRMITAARASAEVWLAQRNAQAGSAAERRSSESRTD